MYDSLAPVASRAAGAAIAAPMAPPIAAATKNIRFKDASTKMKRRSVSRIEYSRMPPKPYFTTRGITPSFGSPPAGSAMRPQPSLRLINHHGRMTERPLIKCDSRGKITGPITCVLFDGMTEPEAVLFGPSWIPSSYSLLNVRPQLGM